MIQAVPSSVIKLASQVLMCLALLPALNSCVIPWFPSDPHEEASELLQQGDVSRDTLVKLIGPPDFVIDDSSYVWITSKVDAYVAFGYNLGTSISDRDFILAVDFDPSGTVMHHEFYSHSGSHDICFNDGICLSPTTLNVPLAPPGQDMKAKRFESVPFACVVYVYRDLEGDHEANEEYVHINMWTESTDQDEKTKTYVEHSAMASVSGGYSYWRLPAPVNVQVQALYNQPFSYGFGVDQKADSWRSWDRTTFGCNTGDVKYVRLFVPKRRKYPSELNLVEAEQARDAIKNLRLVLKLGRSGYLRKEKTEYVVTDPD